MTRALGHDSAPLIAPLRAIANQCTAGACPTVYVAEGSESATAVVQGFVVSAERAGIELPDGELLVEVPLSLLTEAVRNLSSQQSSAGARKEA